jgi:hypothetical protein
MRLQVNHMQQSIYNTIAEILTLCHIGMLVTYDPFDEVSEI